jgi:hypothetical protein
MFELAPDHPAFQSALQQFAEAEQGERGAIYTRREVVEFILDLVGYTSDQPLHSYRLLEPAFGQGDFLLVVVERLLASLHCQADHASIDALAPCIRAVELHPASFQETYDRLLALLIQHGFSHPSAEHLLAKWLIEGDFLLTPLNLSFTHVLGNPPYVRQEQIPGPLLAEYRARFKTLYDRADLYVPFIEKSLQLLAPGGVLGFICSDRWMKNRYGRPLRELVAREYHLRYYIDMVDTDAFYDEVAAYPAITVIARESGQATGVAHRPAVDQASLKALATALCSPSSKPSPNAHWVEGVMNGGAPWVLERFDELEVVRRLEASFPTLEEAQCRVGIGVATGADRVFIAPYDGLDVEPERKLPLVMTADIQTGAVDWRGLGVLNPFGQDGELVELTQYPRFAAYLAAHETTIRNRNVSKRSPARWYRTIDRIVPELAQTPKLLIPDIKGEPLVVYEHGQFYPHHNLYYITSETWDLKALQAVLLSGIARLFVALYSTKMRGGYLRYQAQYLRRIRLPAWSTVPENLRDDLVATNSEMRTRAVWELYGLSTAERELVTQFRVGG